MTQQEVILVLTKHKKSLTSKEIATKLGIAQQNITRSLNKLRKQNLIYFKKIKVPTNRKPILTYKLK